MKSLIRLTVNFPLKEVPRWAPLVERWNQMDVAASACAELGFHLKGLSTRPNLLILASSQASNWTDQRFVASDFSSPSLFTHTLPNVRASAFCKTLDWNGPMFCLQAGKETLKVAQEQARFLVSTFSEIWVLGIEGTNSSVDAEITAFYSK